MLGHSSKQIAFGHVAIQRREETVNARCAMVMNATLVANNTRLHAQHIVLCTLLKVGRIAFLLHFLGLKEVAGVVLVRNGQRHNVQVGQSVNDVSLAANGHHLQNGLLGSVVRVFRPPFALCNPYVFVLLVDGVVHILRQKLARRQHLADRQVAFYDERLVYAHQILHPRQGKQVVANGYFACGRKAIVDKELR